ncbi:MAG: SpoIVB peptidase [Clostridiales bacterium]|nr:SpoIVB peptidase [Clostridiales bacterium]
MSVIDLLLLYRKHRIRIFVIGFVLLIFFALFSVKDYIPDSLYVTRGDPVSVGEFLPVTKTVKDEDEGVKSSVSLTSAECGAYELECRLLGILPVKDVTVHIVEDTQVIPCGVPIGIYMQTEGVYVVDVAEFTDIDRNTVSPAKHILQSGDYIVAVNGETVSEKEELESAIQGFQEEQASGVQESQEETSALALLSSQEEALRLTIRRDGEEMEVEITPVMSESGQYQIGVWVRDDLAGIGTLTYVTEDGDFGALGHSVSDPDTGGQIEMADGTLYLTSILDIVKGEKGSPGELVGLIQYSADQVLGTIGENRSDGIFGTITSLPDELADAEAVSVGYRQEVEEGAAQILMELDGELKTFEIEIESVDLNAAESNKSIRIRVVDEELIARTGGIVQGCSGAPILQNGKIVGAVTHVFISDPAEGYGIFIEDMLQK